MARDKHDELLYIGDPVIIRGRVAEINPVGEFTMIKVEGEEVGYGGHASFMFLNDRQVEKCEEWDPARQKAGCQ